MSDAGSEAFSLSLNPSEQFVPFLSTRECTVPAGVCFGSCQAPPSVFISPFIPPFIIHTPFQTSQILGCSSFNQIFFVRLSLSGLGIFKSASLWEIFFFFGSYVKVLSVASWNYLGAKLIALDPTSHCNRLSANLGFSRCGQVSPWRWLHRAVCSAQGSDLCHTPPSSPLSHAIFVLSVAAKFVRTLFMSEHLPTLPEHQGNRLQLPLHRHFLYIFCFPCFISCFPLMHC